MTIVASEIKAKYPILVNESLDRIQLFINDAINQLDPQYFGGDWPRAVELWVMCRIVNLTPSLRAIGAVQEESITGQGRTIRVRYGSVQAEDGRVGSSNPYCQELESLTGSHYYGGCVY